MANVTRADKRAVAQYLRHTKLVDTSRKLARIVKHVDPSPRTIAARIRREKDLPKWLKYYLPDVYFCKWSKDHLRVLKKFRDALRLGGLFALVMPRGSGKTSLVHGVLLFILMTGLRRFPVAISATNEAVLGTIRFVGKRLLQNDKLHKDYPHITTYARACEGKAIKARFQLRADGHPTGLIWGTNVIRLPNALDADGEGYPGCGSVLEACGITGALRGKWRDSGTGEILRPDFVILEDPQTRESAESDAQCGARERTITGDVLGLAGPRKRIAAVMPCTIIQKGDLADRFLDRTLHPEWAGEIFKLVYAWPRAQETLWAKYGKIYREEIAEGHGFKAATKFYKAHRKKMDAGAKLGWPDRVRDNEISALQTAENLLLEMHEQFWAEMQGDPKDAASEMYRIDSKTIVQHTGAMPKFLVPDAARIIVAFSDVNRHGLHWAVTAFDQVLTAQVVAYGKYPEHGDVWRKNAPELERKQALFAALVGLGRMLGTMPLLRFGKPVRIGVLLIDRGYEPETVHRYIRQTGLPFRALAARGYAGHKYRIHKATLAGSPFEQAHVVQSQGGQFIAHNADYWREIMQRAWLGENGSPGGAMLHKAGTRSHLPFAEQLCSERLRQKYQTDAGIRWEWGHKPGSRNDWGDAMTGCYVAAAASGLTTGGQVRRTKKRRETRKTKTGG